MSSKKNTNGTTKSSRTRSKKPATRTTKTGTGKGGNLDTADTTATRCGVCGSTERQPCDRRDIIETDQPAPDGRPATHIHLQWVKCKNCGQARVDRTYQNRIS